jgi:hypothetical protein
LKGAHAVITLKAYATHISQHLLEDLVSAAPPKNREIEAKKAKARSQKRFAAA